MDNKFNKDFENLGWSEMQKILDRELPVVEKKRRRVLLFWLFFAGVLTTFGAGFLYSKFNKNNETLIVENNQKISQKEANSSINSNENALQLRTNNSLINSNKNELKINKKTVDLKDNLVQLNTVNDVINSDKKELNSINSELKNPELIAQRNTVFNSKINTQKEESRSELISKISSEGTPQYMEYNGIPQIGKSEKRGMLKVDSLVIGTLTPQEVIMPLNINKLKDNLTSNVLIFRGQGTRYEIRPRIKNMIIPKHAKTHFGITTGVHTEGSSLISGWQFGLILNRELNKKWSVSTGLNFRKTTVNVDSLAQLNTSVYVNPVGVTNDPKFGANSDNKIQLKDLNYGELPINLVYNFNKKLSISGGIKIAYLMSTNVSISADSMVTFLRELTLKTTTQSLDYTNERRGVSELGLQRFDAAFMGGINYNLTNKIQLSLRYDYGLKNVLNRQNWTAYNRFLGVNAVYYFR